MNSGRRAMATVFTFLLAALLGPHDFGVVAMALVYVAFVAHAARAGVHDRDHPARGSRRRAPRLGVLAEPRLVRRARGRAGAQLPAGGRASTTCPSSGRSILVLSLDDPVDGLSDRAAGGDGAAARLQAARASATNVAVLLGGRVGIPLALAGRRGLGARRAAARRRTIAARRCSGHENWRPQFRFSLRHARDLLGFSASVFAANVAGFVNRRADALLLGALLRPGRGRALPARRPRRRRRPRRDDAPGRRWSSLPVLSRLQTDPEELRAAIARLPAHDVARDRSRAAGHLRDERRAARRARRASGRLAQTPSSCSASSGSGKGIASSPGRCSSPPRGRASAR